jgi:hypothetical protein
MKTVQPKSWFGLLGSVALGVTFVMTACGGDDGDDGDGDGNGGSNNGGASNGGTNSGGTTTAGAPAQGAANLRKNTAPSAK